MKEKLRNADVCLSVMRDVTRITSLPSLSSATVSNDGHDHRRRRRNVVILAALF